MIIMRFRTVPFSDFNFEEMKALAPNLSGLIRLIEMGSKPTPSSFLVEKVSANTLLSQTMDIIKKTCDGMPILAEVENDKLSKVGPQGANPPWKDKKDKFYEYYAYAGKDYSHIYNSVEWLEALDNVRSRFNFNNSKRPYGFDRVLDVMRKSGKLGTNSGAPLFVKKRDSEAINAAMKAASLGSHEWKKLWAQLGNRSQRGKSRFIFMFPFATTIVENSFVMPVLKYLKELDLPFFSAWEGFSHVENNITPMFKSYENLVGTDFTAMDQHFTVDKSMQVYAVIKHFFQKSQWRALKESMSWAHEIPVLTPDGMIYGEHGMASGSGWTNLSETIFNMILSEFISIKMKAEASETERNNGSDAPLVSMGLGDDGFMATNNPDAADLFVECANSVGLESNRSKQVSSTDYTQYLQRTFIRDYYSPYKTDVLGGVYPIVLAFNSLVYPERYINPKDWSGKMFVIRCLMILENTINHPGFVDFCELIFKLNHNFPEFAKLSRDELLRQEEKARSINGFVPSYNQEKQDTSLVTFESFKILRKLYG